MESSGEHERGLAERLADGAEDRLGRAFSDLLESPLLSGALGRAFDAREKAAQAQELAMGVLNLPSAADVERLTRRLRSVSQRLEGIEDGIARMERNLNFRLESIEAELKQTGVELAEDRARAASGSRNETPLGSSPSSAARTRKGAAASGAARTRKAAATATRPQKASARASAASSPGTGGSS
ncbi:MAG: hypothetical protein ACYCUM_03555 [Solirubrobacteraceae bacterium]